MRFLILFLLLLTVPVQAADRVEDLLRQMTLEEKIGQMTLFTSDWDQTGPSMRAGYLDDIRRGRVGAIFNAYTPEFTRKLQDVAVKETRLGIPLLFGYDVVHGHRTVFPIPLAEACSWDLAMIEGDSRIAATEAAADGLHWTFAPMVDIARDPRWGRIAEGAGEDTFYGCLVARARVRGFQGTSLRAPDSIVACAKHFAAYGAAQGGRDYNTVDVSRRELMETYLPPFQAAVQAGAATIMTSFNEIDGVPSTANGWLLDDVLRREWGFKGFVVTDYTSINEMVNHGIAATDAEAGELAVKAGVDMDMQGAVYMSHLVEQVKSGRVPERVVDDAVRRILRMKEALGLFDDPYKGCDPERRDRTLMTAEHRAAARDAAVRSMVLLKNVGEAFNARDLSRNMLPLLPGERVALVGPLAEARKDLLGSWSAAGDGEKVVSVADGLRSRGVALRVAKGCEIEGRDRSGFPAAVAAAKASDVVVAVMGESAGMSGEAASRSVLGLPGVQRELLAALEATRKPVVLVLINGRPLELTWEDEHVRSILEAWQGGTEAGNAIADVLTGKREPGGRLVVSFPRSVGQIPVHYNHKNTGRPFAPKNKYTSKYLDVANWPLYPFGFGLGYTKYAYSAPTVTVGNGRIDVEATVRNTGKRDGEEVVQLYVRDRVGSVTRPVRELKGFRRLDLRAGEERKVRFTLRPSDLAFLRRDGTWGWEPGDFDVWIAPNAEAGSKGTFRL